MAKYRVFLSNFGKNKKANGINKKGKFFWSPFKEKAKSEVHNNDKVINPKRIIGNNSSLLILNFSLYIPKKDTTKNKIVAILLYNGGNGIVISGKANKQMNRFALLVKLIVLRIFKILLMGIL